MLILISIVAAAALLSLAMLLVLGSLLRLGAPGIRAWFVANALGLLSLPLFALRGVIPDLLSIVLANGLLACSVCLYYAGCAQFLYLPVRWGRLALALGVVCVAVAGWHYVVEDVSMRVLAMAALAVSLHIIVAVLLLRHRPRTRSGYGYWFTAVVSIIFAACQVVRVVYFSSMPPQSGVEVFLTPGAIVIVSVSVIMMPALAMGPIMMIHDAMLAQANDQANHDHMTGALSRRHLERLARQYIATVVRTGQPLSLLLVDLDDFKHVNDTYGHAAGDEVLRQFAVLARAHCRRDDLLGRMGGEEFVLLLPGTRGDEAVMIAERLRRKVGEQPVSGPFGQCQYSISVGVAVWRPAEAFEQLYSRADNALYEAKRSGRNQVAREAA